MFWPVSGGTLVFLVQIRALGRNTRGSIAMRLKEADKMASVDIIPASMRKELEALSDQRNTQ